MLYVELTSVCQQKRQRRFDQERDSAVALLQATFKGHLVRKRLLGGEFPQSAEDRKGGGVSMEEEPQRDGVEGEGQVTEGEQEEEAIQTVQAALKGHLARKTFLNT